MQEPHVPPTPAQQAARAASGEKSAALRQGERRPPAIAATPRPGAFNAPGVVGAKGAPPRPPVTANPAIHAPATGAAHPSTVPAGKLPPPKSQPTKPANKPAKPPAEKNAEKHEEGAKP